MEDDIEDFVGEIKYTDSQKSVTTLSSHLYSPDFTDTSSRDSEKNNSSGKNTYVIEWDSEDSEKTFPLKECVSTIANEYCNTVVMQTIQCGAATRSTKSASTSIHKCSVLAHEIHTQTSKTIIELAENDTTLKKSNESKTLETQTEKTVEYMIEMANTEQRFIRNDLVRICNNTEFVTKSTCFNVICNVSQDEDSSKFPVSETENEVSEDKSLSSSNDQIIRIVNDDSKETLFSANEMRFENNSELNESLLLSDMEEDSLAEDRPRTFNEEIKELRNKLSEDLELCMSERFTEPDIRRFGTLTPLTEESNAKKESLMDITPNVSNMADRNRDEVLFTSNTGMKVKFLKDDDNQKNVFKLPPIQNHSCPNSPHLNSLFGKPKLNKAGTLPSVYERQNNQDRWEITNKNLASGESLHISGKESPKRACGAVQLPPIHGEAPALSSKKPMSPVPPAEGVSEGQDHDPISIKDKIKELKMSAKHKPWTNRVTKSRKDESRSVSPVSMASPDDSRLCDIADRGCETLCAELLRRLRLNSWLEVIETLDEIPKVLEKFWSVMVEQRIADLVRQVVAHVESPRPQVARTACSTVAAILRNTNYTKKPDFHEAVTSLLTKTGSYSRPVRRAANVALDDIVCGVELTHAVTALCIHGVSHKSALVRCAAARLLVVCCALGSGGRDLLRARPASAAAARRHALRALATLLDDKNPDARKYAERLYSILRPLANFEAYYLTDVDVEVASKQMKKYDQLLLGLPKEGR